MCTQPKRPFLATDCDDVRKAEKWRVQVIREVSKKVSQIQNRKYMSLYYGAVTHSPTCLSPLSTSVGLTDVLTVVNLLYTLTPCS